MATSNPEHRGELAPGAEMHETPLAPNEETAPPNAPPGQELPGLNEAPAPRIHPRTGYLRVRASGLMARRALAQARFRDISSKAGPTSETRFLAGLRGRGGLLARARKGARRERFNLRGRGR